MLPLPLLDSEPNTIHIEGLDKLAHSDIGSAALMGEFIGLVAVILIFGTPIVIVLAVLAARARRQRALNDLILKLAEKGQPIPPELFNLPANGVRERTDLQSAIRLIAIGIGLMGFFYLVDAVEGAGIGFIPLMIGVGYLVSWKIEQNKNRP